MNRWKVATYVIRLIFAAPFLYLMWWGYQMSSYTHEMQVASEQALLGEGGGQEMPVMPESPFAFFTKTIDRRQSTSETGLNNNRVISVEEHLTIFDVLRDGEEPPLEEFHALYMTARAPARMIEYCEEALGTLATRCGILRTESRALRKGGFQVRARIAYAPTYEIGPTETIGGEFVFTILDLTPQDVKELPAKSSAVRAQYTTQALQICDRLRDLYGSCVIEDLSFDDSIYNPRMLENMPANTDPIRLRVRARFAVFTIDTREERKLLEDRTKEIIANLN